MIRGIIIVIMFAFLNPATAQNKNIADEFNPEEFIAFNMEKDISNLFDMVIPSKDYAYWEIRLILEDQVYELTRNRKISKGNKDDYESLVKMIDSEEVMYYPYHYRQGDSFAYIIGVRDSSSIDLIDTKDKLVRFIGNVDNPEEIELIADAYGYFVNPDTIIAGGYKERKDDYLLFLSEISESPSEAKRDMIGVTYNSVKAVITKEGNLRVLEKSIYNQMEIDDVDY